MYYATPEKDGKLERNERRPNARVAQTYAGWQGETALRRWGILSDKPSPSNGIIAVSTIAIMFAYQQLSAPATPHNIIAVTGWMNGIRTGMSPQSRTRVDNGH